MNDEFVSVAISCSTYQTREDEPGELFRKIAEQGHYAGRTKPTGTRQGLYVSTPDGKLLSSNNETNARKVFGLLSKTSRQWNAQFTDETFTPSEPDVSLDPDAEVAFPKNGMALRETMRDLPRTNQKSPDQWRHNFDQVWMTTEEATKFLPASLNAGATVAIPEPILNRLALYHLVDHVRGSATPWKKGDIELAELNSKVTKVDDSNIHLEVYGAVKLRQEPSGKVNPFLKRRITKDRGVDLKIAGRLVYDRKSGSFERFDIAAVGDRWGTDVYNHRHNDMGPDPIGFAFTLETSKPASQRKPLFVRRSGYFQ